MHVSLPSQMPSLSYSSLYIFLLFSSLTLCHAFLASFFSFMFSCTSSFLICSPVLLSPYLLFVSQISLPAQFQLFLLAFLLFYPTHQVTHPCLPKSWSPLVKTVLDSLSPSIFTILSLALLPMPFSFSP